MMEVACHSQYLKEVKEKKQIGIIKIIVKAFYLCPNVRTADREIFIVNFFFVNTQATKIKRGENFSTNSTLPRVTRDGSRTVHEPIRCWLAFLPDLSPKRTSGGPGGSHATSEARK